MLDEDRLAKLEKLLESGYAENRQAVLAKSLDEAFALAQGDCSSRLKAESSHFIGGGHHGKATDGKTLP